MPEVSVIVPVYNVEKYLHRCIDSILAQTYSDFELIIVDDGSSDNCPSICDEYASSDSRVRVIHKVNEGVSKARNDGINVARGTYVTFIDSDDYISAHYLEVLYTAIEINDADISVTRRSKKAIFEYEELDYTILTKRSAIEYFLSENSDAVRTPWGKLVRREICEKYLFPVDRSYSEDRAVVYRWYYSANRVVDTKSRLYYYNDENPQSVSQNTNYSPKRFGSLETIDELMKFLKEENFPTLHQRLVLENLQACYSHYKNAVQSNCDKKVVAYLRKKNRQAIITAFRYHVWDWMLVECGLIVYPILTKIMIIAYKIVSSVRKHGLRKTLLKILKKNNTI